MADTILKYVSLENLTKYDEKIKDYVDTADASLKSNLEGQVEVVAGALDSEIARAKAAEQTNATAAQTAQAAADNVATYVGTFTASDGVDTVVKYIDAKTANIASDATVNALTERVTQAEKDIDAIEADYLKAADKETLQGSIDGVAEDVADIAKDYLKAADKTELESEIDLKAAQTALDAEVTRATNAESNLQTQINTIMNNPDAEGAINSINEFTQYVADHGTIADGFRADIDKNKEDIVAEVERAGEAEAALDARLDTLEAIDHDAYKAADTALETKLNAAIALKADQTALNSAVSTLESADATLGSRISALEAKHGDGEGTVESLIATAKQEAVNAAAGDATTKANTAEQNAKDYADGLNTAMDERMDAAEAKAHEHANKAELDLIATGDKAKWDAAEAKAHEHSNLSVLETLTAAKIAAWDAAEQAAKTYADGLNTAMDTRVATLETWHENFDECTTDEINALFA